LAAQNAAVSGAGLVASIGTGALAAASATASGTDEAVLPATVGFHGLLAVWAGGGAAVGARTGVGALVSGAATISGEGEVAGGEVAPPIFVGGGGIHRPQLRPEPVEGVGYGILPQLEGEAHGVVLVAGAGAALPRISGVGTGAVGVAGRSAVRLTAIKAIAIGVRGQVGTGAGVLKGLSVVAAGGAGLRGLGSATIRIKGAAIGRHDDDEAAILALLAA